MKLLIIFRKRQKVVKFLRSNPIQMLLCAIVLLDASIVIVQILLDINSVKGKFLFMSLSAQTLWLNLFDSVYQTLNHSNV